MEPFLNTTTNKRVNPLNLNPCDVDINDIAHALALCNRFAGHTSKPISVAQHSLWVSHLVSGAGYEIEMAALLHDASEAYLGDVTKWLKASPEMKAYRDAEERATRVILYAFDTDEKFLTPAVEEADKRMVCWEAEQGIKGFFDHKMPPGYEPVQGPYRAILHNEWRFVNWQEAEMAFLDRFYGLRWQNAK
jgi:uncharacterized protein